MYASIYTKPNFVAPGYTGGFVSYCRALDRRCTAFWIVMTTARLVEAGEDSELLEMNGGLPSEFGKEGGSSNLLTTEMLGELSWKFGDHHKPYGVSVTQGYELAQLAVALLNYDANHADDDTPVLCTVFERDIVTDMIVLVHGVASRSNLVEQLLEVDKRKLAAKKMSRHSASIRP